MNTLDNEFEKIGRKTPFTVPEGYFDAQRERLLSIGSPKRDKFIMLRRITGVAAVVAVIFAATFLFLNNDPVPAVGGDSLEAYLSSLSDEELAQAVNMAEYDIFYETDSITNY